jgi:hypothetical protein
MAEALADIGLVSAIVQFIAFGTEVVAHFKEFKECRKPFKTSNFGCQ